MIVWRDFHIKRYLIVLFITAFMIFAINASNPTLDDLLSRKIILPLVPLLLLIIVLRIKLTYVREDGICIGNAPNGEYYSLKLSKPKFIIWDVIKLIKIYNKAIKQPLMVDYQSFLLVTTKDNIKYECFIAQPKGFVKALKNLNKHHLLSKDSKYRDTIEK